MKNRKKIMIASFALAAALRAAAGTIFAWFIKPQSSVVVVTGDARLQASGYYAVVSTEESAVPEYRPLDKTSLTKITDLDQNHYIAFLFDVTNQTETDVNLSLRLGEFSEYIFSLFSDYRAECGEQSSAAFTPSETLLNNAMALAAAHTAKFTLSFDDFNYRYADVTEQTDVALSTDGYLWRYAFSEKVAENIPLAPQQSLSLCFSMVIRQSMEAIDAYRGWLCGTASQTGYGQSRCANLGYTKTFDALTENERAIVDAYLAFFMQCEIDALNADDLTNAQFNLDIDYFEFIGENA